MTTPSRNEVRTRQRARAEAASWIAKLHGSGRTPAMERSWRRWLDAHPENSAAWELATEVYADTGDLPAKLPTPPGDVDEESQIPWRAIATVTLLALVTVIAVVWNNHRERSHTFQTALGEQRTVLLKDGTRVELNTSSRIIEHYSTKTRAVSLEAGEVYFKITPDQRRPFVVFAGGQAILALGTEFVIRRVDERGTALTVTLIAGKAAVVPAPSSRAIPTVTDPGALTLKPGQRFRLTSDRVPHIDTPALDREMAWRQGRLVFDNTSLSEAVDELNRYNIVKLRLSPNVPASIRVGGTFLTTDAENFAQAQEAQHHLQLVHDSQGLLLQATPH